MANDIVDSAAGGNPYAAPGADMSYDVPGDDDRATRTERFLASVIDLLIMSLVAYGPFALLGGNLETYVGALGHSFDNIGSSDAPPVLSVLYGLALGLLINGFTLARRGQSLGKLLMRIRIVRRDGQLAGFARLVLLRALPFTLVNCLPYLNLLAWIETLFIFRESRLCLHDQIADTKVVKVRAKDIAEPNHQA